jgi:hypothetical protein
MKIAIMTSLPAEWYMNVNSRHVLKIIQFDFRQVNLPAEGNRDANPGQIKYF